MNRFQISFVSHSQLIEIVIRYLSGFEGPGSLHLKIHLIPVSGLRSGLYNGSKTVYNRWDPTITGSWLQGLKGETERSMVRQTPPV